MLYSKITYTFAASTDLPGRIGLWRKTNTGTPEELVTLMVGRKVDMSYHRGERPAPGACLLDVRDVSAANGIRGVSLKVHAGEIVGLSGLVGSGRTEVARAIFGAEREGKLMRRATAMALARVLGCEPELLLVRVPPRTDGEHV